MHAELKRVHSWLAARGTLGNIYVLENPATPELLAAASAGARELGYGVFDDAGPYDLGGGLLAKPLLIVAEPMDRYYPMARHALAELAVTAGGGPVLLLGAPAPATAATPAPGPATLEAA